MHNISLNIDQKVNTYRYSENAFISDIKLCPNIDLNGC